jgi:hypothetical protein
MERSAQAVQYVEINGIKYPRPIKNVAASFCRKQSDPSLTGSSAQERRESKSGPYRGTRYATLLAAKGQLYEKVRFGHYRHKQNLVQGTNELGAGSPEVSLLQDDKTCRRIEDRNEARIAQDNTPLIVPSGETLATCGAGYLDHLIEMVNDGWTGSIPVEGPRRAARLLCLDSVDPHSQTSSSTSSTRSSAASMISPCLSQPTGCTSRSLHAK